ncbi:MAG: hypothetical protein WKI04_00485 [Ferruginibacter sp.]
MKKQFVLMVLTALFGVTAVKAQGSQRQTIEERTKATMEKLAVFNLDADTKTKAEAAIVDYNTSIQNAIEELRAAGSMNRDSAMAKRKFFSEARDAKLKTILTPEQMKKWTDEIEPSLRSQRGRNQPGSK